MTGWQVLPLGGALFQEGKKKQLLSGIPTNFLLTPNNYLKRLF